MVTINKLDAAREQLEAASELYFREMGIASIHTLAAAAFEVVEALAERRETSTLIQENLLNYLTEEMKQEVLQAMRTPQNFFKHADRDPEAELELEPKFTEMLMIFAVTTYWRLTGQLPPICDAFANWVLLQQPEWLKNVPAAEGLLRKAKELAGSMSRMEFRDGYLANCSPGRA